MPIEDPTLRNARDAELVTYANDIAAAIRPTAARYDRTGEFPFEHFEILSTTARSASPSPRNTAAGGSRCTRRCWCRSASPAPAARPRSRSAGT